MIVSQLGDNGYPQVANFCGFKKLSRLINRRILLRNIIVLRVSQVIHIFDNPQKREIHTLCIGG